MTNSRHTTESGHWARSSSCKPWSDLDTVDIADRLDHLSGLAAMLAVAIRGLFDSPSAQAADAIVFTAWDTSEKLTDISGILHPQAEAPVRGAGASRAWIDRVWGHCVKRVSIRTYNSGFA